MRKSINIPVRPTQCATCPFRDGSKYKALQDNLSMSALSEGSRICHQTGTNAIGGRTGKPNQLCRGARDLQLRYFHTIGFIEAPTDEAWRKKAVQMGLIKQ